jgi:hypothetical protein
MSETKRAEPSSLFRPPLFMVGRDEGGNWVAQALDGACGGLFVSRDAALRYIRLEKGRLPQAVVMVSGVLELDMKRKPVATMRRDSSLFDSYHPEGQSLRGPGSNCRARRAG